MVTAPVIAPGNPLSAYGKARSTITGTPLNTEQLRKTHAYWRACNYLMLGMIYLQDNPLLKKPLKAEQIKSRLLGHWGASPGLAFVYIHLNRLIKKYDQDVIFLAGPGHGAPGILAPIYLEGSYSEIYTDKSEDEQGMREFFKQFSFPGGIGSHCTPETPGSIHEGGELGYVLSHACGAAFDNPELIVAAVVGDGEAETGALATSWHINKFLNPVRDGAVLPILHLNGYKINNPTLLARISHEELENLLLGYGWTPYFVEGSDPESMHQAMAATTEHCFNEIRRAQQKARMSGVAERVRWPMIVLRTPKGWTAPQESAGHRLEGFWRAHQVPMADVKKDPKRLEQLERWMHSYRPEELFDENGTLIPELKELSPVGERRMGANPHGNGGVLKKALRLPDFRQYAFKVKKPGTEEAENTRPLGAFLRDVMKLNMKNFRVFGPDENSSNRLGDIYTVSKKFWIAEHFPEDSDGGELAPDGRVMEMLSEHTVEGMLEGYLLTGRHGFISSYEAFIHVIDSMFNQHAKWLSICNQLSWRAPIASLNMLVTSTVWRQDHNGFTHQDPGFLDVVVNKSAEVTRIYLPPDVNSLLSVADHCLRSENYVNVIVCDKQMHLQYLSMEDAIIHCTKGIGTWNKVSPMMRATNPTWSWLRPATFPPRKLLPPFACFAKSFLISRFDTSTWLTCSNLQPSSEHPHGMPDRDFDALFTVDKPIIFNFHGYPWLIHRLAYRRTNHKNMHVRGYKEKGNINTPLELAIENEIDRFSLAMDAIRRVPRLQNIGGRAMEKFLNEQIRCRNYAYEHGTDKPDVAGWTWPY